MLRYIFIAAIAILGVNSGSEAFSHPCRSCTTSGQTAFSAYRKGQKIEPFDPLTMPVVKIDNGHLKLELNNVTVTGLKSCAVKTMSSAPNTTKQFHRARCSFTVKGFYNLQGELLQRPANGTGPFNIIIDKIYVKAMSDLSRVQGPDKKLHYKINRWRYNFQVLQNATFHFENLRIEPHIEHSQVQTFLNSRWSDVMKEIGGPVIRAIVSKVYGIVDKFFDVVPADKIELK